MAKKKQTAKGKTKKSLKKKGRVLGKSRRVQKIIQHSRKTKVFKYVKKTIKKKSLRMSSIIRKKIGSIIKKRRGKNPITENQIKPFESMEPSISYMIRVMPVLSDESFDTVTKVEEIQNIQETQDIIIAKEFIVDGQEENADIKSADTKITSEKISFIAPSAGFVEKEKIFISKNSKETSFIEKIFENVKVLKELTIYRILYFILWPIFKIYSLLYWTSKLYFVKMKNANGKSSNAQVESEVVDVFSIQQKKQKQEKEYSFSFRRYGAISVGFAALIGLSFFGNSWYEKVVAVRSSVMVDSQYAIESMKEGQNSVKSLNLEEAAKKFENAKIYFEKAKNEFARLDIVTRTLTQKIPRVGKNIKAGFLLLDAGKNIAEAGEKLSAATHSLLFEPSISQENSIQSFINKLLVLEENLNFAIPKIAQARLRIEDINIDTISLSNKEALYTVQQTLPAIEENLTDVSALTETLLRVMGYAGGQRYLLLFENSNELRATGGFIGSFALVDINNGEIKNLEIPAGGSYDLQGSLTALVQSPKPLHIINPIWEFQDSNWWPDFPTTAKKISWFYQKAQGPSVDGVIAITSSLMEKILEVAGPISMEDYGRIITSENFVDETQKIVELEYDKVQNKPKQFIADLAPELFKKISNLNQAKIQELLTTLYQGFKEKQILAYSGDSKIQKIIEELDWGGVVKDSQGGDYLAIIHSNIAGAKTDEVINDSIRLDAEILYDGSIVNTLTITREHTGVEGDMFTGVQNNSYVRIYVPKGSILISTDGFTPPHSSLFEEPPFGYSIDEDMAIVEGKHMVEPASLTDIYNENEKTVFGNWIMTRPGETKKVVIQYKLPLTITPQNPIYTLTLQKQAGKKSDPIVVHIAYPQGFTVKETYPKLNEQKFLFLQSDVPSIFIRDVIHTDKFYGIVFNDVNND